MFPFDYGTELVFDYGHLDAELIFHRRLSSCIVGMLLVSLQFLHTFLHVKPSSRLCCHGYPFILHILMENLGHYLFFFLPILVISTGSAEKSEDQGNALLRQCLRNALRVV